MTTIVTVDAHCSSDTEVVISVRDALTGTTIESQTIQDGEHTQVYVYDDRVVCVTERTKVIAEEPDEMIGSEHALVDATLADEVGLNDGGASDLDFGPPPAPDSQLAQELKEGDHDLQNDEGTEDDGGEAADVEEASATPEEQTEGSVGDGSLLHDVAEVAVGDTEQLR